MHPVVIENPASQPWTPATVSLALSAVLMVALFMLGADAFVSHR